MQKQKPQEAVAVVLPPQAKIIVPDTNVFINDPWAVDHFGENEVVIPIWVIAELDEKKREQNGVGMAARAASNAIYSYYENSSRTLNDGVRTKAGGLLRITTNRKSLPVSGLKERNDKFIVESAYYLLQEQSRRLGSGRRMVELVTNDTNMILIASAVGIRAKQFERPQVVKKLEDLYTGIAELSLCENEAAESVVQALYSKKGIAPFDQLAACVKDQMPALYPNQACVLRFNDGNQNSSKRLLTIYRKFPKEGALVEYVDPKIFDRYGSLKPRNDRQAVALQLLLDKRVQLVTLTGIGGGGKTIQALIAAMNQIDDYEQIMIFRPVVEAGQSLGYLPGSLEEKINPWARPITDNLELIVAARESLGKKLQRTLAGKGEGDTPSSIVRQLLADERIVVDSINHLRGRSLNNRFCIFDESQNFTKIQIKLAGTRPGDKTKVVFTGDLEQVDLDVHSTSSGLAALVEYMKGDAVAGHMEFDRSERSYLAEKIAGL